MLYLTAQTKRLWTSHTFIAKESIAEPQLLERVFFRIVIICFRELWWQHSGQRATALAVQNPPLHSAPHHVISGAPPNRREAVYNP